MKIPDANLRQKSQKKISDKNPVCNFQQRWFRNKTVYVGGQENQTIKAHNSQQSWFCDRTAYVGGQDFRPKLRFSCRFAATLRHFVPPWKTLGWIQLLVRLWIFAFDTLIAGRWYLMVLVLVLVLVMLYWYRHCYHQCYWYRYDQMSQIATQLNRFRPCAGTLMHLPNHRQTESWQNWNQLYIKIALSPQIVSNSLKKSIIVNTSSPHLITIVVHIGLGHRFDKIVRSKNFTFALREALLREKMFSFGQWGLSPHLVPISVAEGPHLVPISLKMRSPFGPHFEKFRSPFHVGAVRRDQRGDDINLCF